jgi:hypothetical protein
MTPHHWTIYSRSSRQHGGLGMSGTNYALTWRLLPEEPVPRLSMLFHYLHGDQFCITNLAGTVKLFRNDMNTLYNYGTLPILQHNRYAVTFMCMLDGTASLVVMISFWEWFDTLTLQPSIHVNGVGIPRNVRSRFEQHVSGGQTREGKFHILPLVEHFEQSRGPCRVCCPQAHEEQYRQHKHGSLCRQKQAP